MCSYLSKNEDLTLSLSVLHLIGSDLFHELHGCRMAHERATRLYTNVDICEEETVQECFRTGAYMTERIARSCQALGKTTRRIVRQCSSKLSPLLDPIGMARIR